MDSMLFLGFADFDGRDGLAEALNGEPDTLVSALTPAALADFILFAL
jgi:hypothetical protein